MTESKSCRKNIRLKDFDYSSDNAYFVTICTKDRKNLLGKVISYDDFYTVPKVELSGYGKIAEVYIRSIPGIDKYVIMPNHVHLIVIKDGSMWASTPTTLSSDIRSFKTLVSKAAGFSIWQRSFYEHIIRCENDYWEIWKYIDENPAKWAEDKYYS